MTLCFTYLNYMCVFTGMKSLLWAQTKMFEKHCTIPQLPLKSIFIEQLSYPSSYTIYTTKTYNSKPWFCFLSVDITIDFPIDLGNYLSQISTLYYNSFIVCQPNIWESALSENPFKVNYKPATITKVRMHQESNYIKAKKSFKFMWSDFFFFREKLHDSH